MSRRSINLLCHRQSFCKRFSIYSNLHILQLANLKGTRTMIRQALAQSSRTLQPCSFRAGARRALPRTHNFAASSLRPQQRLESSAWRSAAAQATRSFSSARALFAEAEGSNGEGSTKKEQKSKKSSSSSSSEDRGQAGKSPFAVFVDVLKEELQKSREMSENIKQLQGETTKAMDSEAMKKMKAAYEKARVSCKLALAITPDFVQEYLRRIDTVSLHVVDSVYQGESSPEGCCRSSAKARWTSQRCCRRSSSPRRRIKHIPR